MRVAKVFLITLAIPFVTGLYPVLASNDTNIKDAVYTKTYSEVTSDKRIMDALDVMVGVADFSRKAILGSNLSGKPMIVSFLNLSRLNPAYANYDALGMKSNGRLYIYINEKHQNAPAPAIASLLSHEALHQDEFNSINEETYAWTMEAAVWTQLKKKYPDAANSIHPLVRRENTLSKMFVEGNYSSKYIRQTVASNPGYQGLPAKSPGFENVD